MMSTVNQNDKVTTVLINKTEYDFRVILISPENRFFVFRPEAIKELSICSTINNYYATGHLVIDDSYDVLERPAGDGTKPFAFRGDSREYIKVEITPKLTNNNITAATSDKVKSVFTLAYDFAIHNIEDLLDAKPNVKYRKLHLWDMWHQIMIERNIQFSTSEALTGVPYKPNVNNEDRGIPTGTAIKEVIKKALPADEGFNPSFSVFDVGSTNVFFTSPANYKAEDCIQYLLERHVTSQAENYDRSFLKIERYPKAWSLTSLKSLFDQAYDAAGDAGGQLFLEKFIIAGNSDVTASNKLQVIISRAPKVAVYFADTNTIDNFSFIPPAGRITQQRVNNRIVHNYDQGSKMFSVDTKDNTFDTVQTVYKQNYVDSMKGHNGKPASNLVGNFLRNQCKNVEHVYSTASTPNQRLGVGRGEALMQAVLNSNTIIFRARGATYRDAGRFIGIDRDNSLPDSTFDSKMLGIYLIVSVTHSFIGGDYYTDMICVKTYNFADTGEAGQYI